MFVGWKPVVVGASIVGLLAAFAFDGPQYQQWRAKRMPETEQTVWQNVDCANESSVLAYLQKYPNGRYRGKSLRCWRQIIAADFLKAEGVTITEAAKTAKAKFHRRYGRAPSPRRTSGLFGATDLHRAAKKRWATLAYWLINSGADLDAKTIFGRTPLITAASKNAVDVVKLLLANGAGVHVKPRFGIQPLYHAMRPNGAEIVKLLIANGAPVNAQSGYHEPPLHYAVSKNAMEVAELLLANGADVHAHYMDNETALHVAVSKNAVEFVKLLIANGAEVKPKTVKARRFCIMRRLKMPLMSSSCCWPMARMCMRKPNPAIRLCIMRRLKMPQGSPSY